MKRIATPVSLAVLLVFAASARAQSEIYASTTSETGARIDTRVTMSPEPLSALAPDVCTANATTLCLNNARFQARAIFSAPSLGITNAPAQAVSLTGDTGYFWFFSANNVEITLKVVDGRTFNGFFWAFYAALSDVAYTITITDMDTGAVKIYSNAPGSLTSAADVTAFAGGSMPPSGNYNGSWTGPTSQGRTVTFNIANNALTSFTLIFPLSGSCTQGSLGVIFSTPRALTGNTFTFTSTSALGSLTASGTLSSNTTGSGTANYTLNPTAPSFCSGTGSATWTASRP